MPKKTKKSPKHKRGKVGRPTELTEELSMKIREGVFAGYTYVKIQKILDIPTGTWDEWVRTNYHGFRTNLMTYNHELKLAKASANIDSFLELKTIEPVIGMFGPIVDKKTKKAVTRENDKLLKIKADASFFVAETLGRKYYTKKVETEDVTRRPRVFLKRDRK